MRAMILAIAAAAVPLGGCVASLAASAAGMAIQSAQREPQSNAHLKPTARQACTQRAAQYGAVHIIDVEQRRADRIIVWGTVTDARERRGFQCHFTTAIADFELRAIRTRS